MPYKKIRYSLQNSIARISLDDPATLNAATAAMGDELLDALRRASREARAVVLTGEGGAFCSGANLADAEMLLADPFRDGGADLDVTFNPVVLTMKSLDIPIVTAVSGVAAGVGCGIAMAGDLIVFGENGYFLLAFRHVGLVPDGGASWLLSRAVGRVRAMEAMLLGERIYGPKALEWGLITRVVPDKKLENAAREMALAVASGPRSMGMIKRLAWAAADSSFEAALANERKLQMDASRTKDFVEGVMAFSEKRSPLFKGE